MFINETQNNIDNNVKASMAITKWLRLIFLILGIVATLAGIALAIVYFTVLKDHDPFNALYVLVLGIAFFALGIAYPNIIRKSITKNMQGKEAANRFVFSEDGYEISSRLTDATSSETKGNYDGLTEGREYRDFWLIYLNKVTFFILLKNGMIEGTAEDFSAFLRGKLGIRYKVKK